MEELPLVCGIAISAMIVLTCGGCFLFLLLWKWWEERRRNIPQAVIVEPEISSLCRELIIALSRYQQWEMPERHFGDRLNRIFGSFCLGTFVLVENEEGVLLARPITRKFNETEQKALRQAIERFLVDRLRSLLPMTPDAVNASRVFEQVTGENAAPDMVVARFDSQGALRNGYEDREQQSVREAVGRVHIVGGMD